MRGNRKHQHLRALLWKNWLLKLRHPWITLLEISLPSIVMLLLMIVRTKVDFHTHPAAEYVKTGMFVEVGKSKFSPSFNDLLGLWASNGEHLAFVPDNEDTKMMINILSLRYPLLQVIGKLYPDELSLEEYIRSADYGVVDGLMNVTHPKIKGAVVFFEQGPCLFDYSIRLNHSWAFHGFPDVTTIMDTTGSYVNDLELGLDLVPTYEYGYSGFLTIQQLIDSYIILIAQQRNKCSVNGSRENEAIDFQHNVNDEKVYLPTENASQRNFIADSTWMNYIPKEISIVPFPTREYTDDEFQSIVKSVLGILYVLAFIFPLSRLISNAVLEKERKITESMHMVGLSKATPYYAWFITYALQFAVSSALITVVTMDSIFRYSSKSLVFMYFLLFGISAVTLSFFIESFFSRAKTAIAVGTLSFIGAYFPYYMVVDTEVSMPIKMFASLLSPTAFALGTVNFADYERAHVGVRWSNIWKESSGVTFLLCFVMMAFDAVLYSVACWCRHKLSQSGYEVCLRRIWSWRYERNQPEASEGVVRNQGPNEILEEEHFNSNIAGSTLFGPSSFEKVSMDLQQLESDSRCIQMKNLRKVFHAADGECVAVHSLDLTLYEGQILSLLGHNGAGKSTTIAMLVGLTCPTSGDAFILGRSVKTDMDEIRKHLGVCPQFDTLFPELTVREHLVMFGTLKGIDRDNLETQIISMMNEVGLTQKSETMVCQLSGGMCRKLSLAIALLGNSKVVILDEPTSGMDPYSMRSTWDLLRRFRKGRIILLTTHSMEEADILGDRIAIMSNGVLRCCGSSLFLKHQFGVGYTLTLVKKGLESCGISDVILKYVPSAALISDVGQEMSFRLPLASSAAFKSLFDELEKHVELNASATDLDSDCIVDGNIWKIGSYGISVTTLEEVFLRVSKGTLEPAEIALSKDLAIESDDSSYIEKVYVNLDAKLNEEIEEEQSRGVEKKIPFGSVICNIVQSITGKVRRHPLVYLGGEERSLFRRHFYALLLKRALCARRDKKTVIFQLIIPALFLLFGLLFLIAQPHHDQPSVTLTTSYFNPLVGDGGGGGPIPFNLSLPLATEVARHIKGGWIQKAEQRFFSFPDYEEDLVQAINVAGPERALSLLTMSGYLLTSLNESYQSRYGAVVMYDQETDGSLGYTILHNSTCQHAAPTYINVMNSAILRLATKNSAMSIQTRNHPLPVTESQKALRHDLNAFSAGIIVNVAYSFIPASFAVPIVKEREVKIKHQQLISGVSLLAYWMSTYVWDFLSYLMPASLAIGLFAVFGMEEFVGNDSLLATAILMLGYGPAIAASTYCLTFFFTDHSFAQNTILLIHFLGGIVLMVTSFIMSYIRATKHTNHILKNIFRLSPGFCLADGLASLALRRQTLKPSSDYKPFDWNVAGASITYLFCEAVAYLALVFMLELMPPIHVLFAWLGSAFSISKFKMEAFSQYSTISEPLLSEESYILPLEDEDADVARERYRVTNGGGKESVVKLINLHKVYGGSVGQPAKAAVQSLTFAIDAGECFGFLGINGAGKTTTLSMLCGEIMPTGGKAYIVGRDVCKNPTSVRRLIGYCPQFDALIDLLTVEEQLKLYARIKAVPEDEIKKVVRDKMKEFDLVQYANHTSCSLSGGNKRKLSVAVAMIGNPPIVILDEPSTGMDPVAKRFMWDVIASISTRQGLSAVILTTHSMAEAQALCTRIGIMVGGRLRCLGSPQHLKNRFGNCLELEVKAAAISPAEVEQLCIRLLSYFAKFGEWGDERRNLDKILQQNEIEAAAAFLAKEKYEMLSAHSFSGSPPFYDFVENELTRDGTIHIKVFCEWWLAKERAKRVDSFIRLSFPEVSLLERNGNSLRYKLPYAKRSLLAEVFGQIEQHRLEVGITEYSVGQATLEAVFNGFAAHQ